jgi:beta-ketodecanoyl-[acyl-carrier-protein] synthase
VICAASNHERTYPAISIEIQELLGTTGFAFDMNVACSSATFGLQAAADMIRAGSIDRAIVVSPEICSAISSSETSARRWCWRRTTSPKALVSR